LAKATTVYVCQECGAVTPKWAGRCGACGEWNSLVEERATPTRAVAPLPTSKPIALAEISLQSEPRISTGVPGLDTVLGGGLVPGSVVLVGGEPGIGKSTIVTQAALHIPDALYLSAEESPRQLKMRTDRLGKAPAGLMVSAEPIIDGLNVSGLDLLIVDSIQTVRTEALDSPAGSVGQVRECTSMLQRLAKESGCAVVLIGHVTKEGSLAGPRLLEHLVDVVLNFEGDRSGAYRVLRAAKNRFGATDEIALFEMGESGLRDVENLSGALLAERQAGVAGSAVVPTVEGTRCVLAEVQALCANSFLNNPRRVVTGVDFNRMTILLAVMEKRLGMRMGVQDVFVNVAGGLRIVEPAADLAALLAAASSMKAAALPADLVAFGEVGLGGELRSVGHAERRLKEAARVGFRRAVVAAGQKVVEDFGIRLMSARDVGEALEKTLSLKCSQYPDDL